MGMKPICEEVKRAALRDCGLYKAGWCSNGVMTAECETCDLPRIMQDLVDRIRKQDSAE